MVPAPSSVACHIRDSKVWKNGDTFYMLLGGRKLGDISILFLQEIERKSCVWTDDGILVCTQLILYSYFANYRDCFYIISNINLKCMNETKARMRLADVHKKSGSKMLKSYKVLLKIKNNLKTICI